MLQIIQRKQRLIFTPVILFKLTTTYLTVSNPTG